MKPNSNYNQIILAFKRAIEATFDESKWYDLGYLTNSINIITNHSRLLRSLHWGDDDYGKCVAQVIPSILGERLEYLKTVENFVNLREWLKDTDSGLYADLYGGVTVSFDEIEKANKIHSVHELNQYVARIKSSIASDPALAVGSSKELLETVMKTILVAYGVEAKNNDLLDLLKSTQKALNIDPKSTIRDQPGSKILQRTLSNLGQVVVGVGEIRNLTGTGHGRSRGPQIDMIHALLVVNAATTIATYLLEIFELQYQQGFNPRR